MAKNQQMQTTQKGALDNLREAFNQDLTKLTPYLEVLLPFKEGVQKFIRMAMLAIWRDPNLLSNRKSLLLAILWCADKDLEPGVEDGAWLVPFGGIVVPIPAYKGLIKKAEESGSVKDIQPWPIYEHDTFEWHLGLDPHLIHDPPKFGSDRGPLIGAYVVITKPDGTKRFAVMDRKEIEAIRDKSAGYKSGKQSPWTTDEEAMFLKTVIKRGLKYINVKPALRDILSDDSRFEIGETAKTLLLESGKEIGRELPEDLVTDDEPELKSAKQIDTSEFDKLAAEKLQGHKERLDRLEKFLKETAENQAKPISPEELKVYIVKNSKFESFWAFFMEKTDGPQNLPPEDDGPKEKAGAQDQKGAGEAQDQSGAGEPPNDQASHQDQSGPGTASSTKNECFAHGPYEGDECPDCAKEKAGAGYESDQTAFENRQAAVWNMVVNKGMTLPIHCGEAVIRGRDEITPENIDDVEKVVEGYEPPKKRGGGKKK